MTYPYACAHCRERLPWYAAGTLPQDERAGVEEHLAGCAECQWEAQMWRAASSALKEMVAEPPGAALEEVTWRGVLSRIAVDGRASKTRLIPGLKERVLMDDEPRTIATAPSAPPRGVARPTRRQLIAPLAAVVLLIALSATLFGVFGARLRPHSPSTGSSGSACSPSQLKASLPAHAVLDDISMVSDTDGWAVGEIWDTSATGAAALPRSLLLRFQHCAWTEAGQSIPSAELFSVVMNSASDGWALGATATPAGGAAWLADQAFLLHYTGGSWRRVDVNSGHRLQNAILRMRSQNDGWLMLSYGVPEVPALYHYQGSGWTQVTLPGALQSGSIVDLATSGSNDVWLEENASNGAITIGHDAAGQWSSWQLSPAEALGYMADALRANSPQDVWMFGRHGVQTSAGHVGEPYILHYNGTNWTSVQVGLKSPATDVQFWTTTVTQPDGGFLALGSVTPPTSGVLDPSNTRTLVLRCSAGGCQQQAFPLQDVSFVYAVSLYAPTQGFAIGDITTGVNPHSTTFMLFYNAGDWTRIPA